MLSGRYHSIIIYAIILLIIMGFAFWFYTHFERVSETIEVGFQAEAYHNTLLAAEHLLQRMSLAVHSSPSFPQGLRSPPQETVVLAQPESPLDQFEEVQLLAWVAAGGHLIMVSDSLSMPPDDPFLEILGIYQYENEEIIGERRPTSLPWEGYPLQVDFHPGYRLRATDPTPEFIIRDDYGIHLLHYIWKQGMITVLSDLWFIENDQIGAYDHAQFFWQLVNFKRTVEQVWFWYSPPDNTPYSPSLWSLLWRQASWVIITAMIFIIVGLWALSRRFGPLLPEPPPKRRRLLEHIEATGHFLWQHQQGVVLLRATQQAVFERLESRYPEWRHLTPPQQVQHLAHTLSPEAIDQALYGHEIQSAAAFTQMMQILTQIKSTL